MDGSAYQLRLVAQTPEKVWGVWENPETGFEQLTDSAGRDPKSGGVLLPQTRPLKASGVVGA